MVHRSEATALGSFALVCVFVLSLPLVTTRIYASDEVESFAWVRSWVFDRDVNFENEYQHFYDSKQVQTASFHETFLERENEAGRRLNFMPIGTAILWLPFYGAGHLAALATGAPADGFSAPYISAVAYGSAIYGFLAIVLSLGIARRLVGHGLASSLAIWIGTPLLFYMYVAPPMSHACSAFAVSLFLWTWLHVRERWSIGGVVLLGLTGALMAMVREQDVFFLAVPAIDFVRLAARRRDFSRDALVAAAGAASFLLAYSPQLAAYNALNGHPGPTSYVTRKMTWTAPHSLQVLFSPEHGLFAWTPLALLGIAGLVLLALGRVPVAPRESRWLAGLLLVAFALQVYVNGSVESWTVAGSFGQRRFVAITPLLVAGLAALAATWSGLVRRRWLHAVAAIVVAAGIWWNLGLMIQFGLNRMDRQRLTLSDNMWTTFVVLPADAPGILWRYLTNRESFYGLPHQ
ncbi:MAG TPA: hypothetical protein VJN96_15155 [Vicinamibacterales bacterium]|nr:hypothetical protein [Vicinamibacterales bacterium]